MKRYVAVRSSSEHRDAVWQEFREGRMRQGWGYLARQDLRLIRAKLAEKKPLDDQEIEAWRNRRLLDTEPDGLKTGDVVMMPNLAAYGTWVFGRVVEGGYKFDPLHVSVAWGDGFDFAHLVPVEPVRTPAGEVGLVHPDCAWSDARLRTSAKCRSRTWSLDWLARAVERLVGAVETGKPTHHPQAADAKLVSLQSALTDAAWRGIQERYQAAELESLTSQLFARIYARDGEGARVDATGGRNENGADLIVFSQDALGIEYKVGVQVKNFQGVHDDAGALDQIKTARARHRIDAGVVLTTADETSDAFEKRREALESELGIDIKVIRRAEFLSLVLAHLGPEVSAT